MRRLPGIVTLLDNPSSPWQAMPFEVVEMEKTAVQIVCLDLEGVLIPEIWIEFAQRSGVSEFTRTTRDEPDYDKLMKYRLDLLKQHDMKVQDIEQVIGTMKPLPGAKSFLDELRRHYQVVILSDTFYPFARPLMAQLDWPTLFCHKLVVDDQGVIQDYRLRMPDHKRAAVKAFQGLNFRVVAAGDSYNDTGMLGQADAGFFIFPPESITEQFKQFPVMSSHQELLDAINTFSDQH